MTFFVMVTVRQAVTVQYDSNYSFFFLRLPSYSRLEPTSTTTSSSLSALDVAEIKQKKKQLFSINRMGAFKKSVS